MTRAALPRPPALAAVVLAAALLALAGAVFPAGAGAFRIAFRGEGRSDTVETMDVGGVTYFRVADLSRAVGAVRHWNAQNGKLTLSVNGHRISASADNQFVRCDGEVRNLRLPLLREAGGLWAPPAYLTDALAWATDSDVTWDAEAAVVNVMTHGVVVTSASIEGGASGTALVIGLSGQAEFSADEVDDSIEILVRAEGVSDSLALPYGAGVILGVAVERLRSGVLVTARLADDAGGYSTTFRADPPRLEVVVKRQAGGTRPAREESRNDQNGHGVDRTVDTVIIDPGHGGSDFGAWFREDLHEKDLNLEFAAELERALEHEGFHVLTTRTADEGVPLARRAETANLAVADVFLSIHCGAAFSDAARGVRISSSAPSRRAGASGRWRDAGVSRASSRWDRAQDAFAGASRELAGTIRGRVALRAERPELQTGDFTSLSGCSMPAVLIEIGFVTNAADARLLADEDWRRGLARAIASGVSDFRADSAREAM